MHKEAHDPLRDLDHVGALFHHNDRPGAQHRPGCHNRLKVHRRVQVLCGEHRRGCAARNDGFERLAAAHSARVFVDDLSQWSAQREFVVAPLAHVPADTEQLGAGASLGADGSEPGRAPVDDRGDIGQCLHVVHQRGLAPQTDLRWIGRLEAWLAALAFQRVDQRRLFPADVGTRASVDRKIDVEPTAQDILAQEAMPVRIVDGLDPSLDAQEELAPDVDERPVGVHCVGGNDRALDDRVWVVLDQEAILKGARFPLVRIDAYVLGLVSSGHKPPLQTGGETRAATTTQSGFPDFGGQFVRRHLEGFSQGGVSSSLHVHVDLFRVGDANVSRQDRFELGAHSPALPAS